jgi:hypothetical protein
LGANEANELYGHGALWKAMRSRQFLGDKADRNYRVILMRPIVGA